jgi:hypothetical protein
MRKRFMKHHLSRLILGQKKWGRLSPRREASLGIMPEPALPAPPCHRARRYPWSDT